MLTWKSMVLTLFMLYPFYFFAAEETPKLIIDSKKLNLTNFRKCSDAANLKDVNLIGLKDLKCSGSAQPSPEAFKELSEKIKSNCILIVDLRQESHGILNNKYPVSWYGKHNWANENKSLFKINIDEMIRLVELLNKPQISISDKSNKYKINIKVTSVQKEETLAAVNQMMYIRLPVTDKKKPNDRVVNEFVNLVNGLPDDIWFHFHCKAGEGRTTTFMAMFDMMRNADRVSFEDILKRQHIIGGVDLTVVENNNPPKIINDCKKERLDFLKMFHNYCRENKKTGFQKPFSEWKPTQDIKTPVINPQT